MHFTQSEATAHASRMPTTYQVRSATMRVRQPVAGRAGAAGGAARRIPPVGGPGPDVRRRPVQPAGRGDRGTGVRRDRPGGRGRGPPVDRRDRAAGRRAAPVALVHRGAVAPGAAARGGLRHHEPVPVHRDRPARPRPGGDAGVPRPARRRPGHVAPPGGPRVRAGGRRGRGRAHPPAAGHRLSSASAWAYWPPPAGPATSCSTGRSGGACPAPRARRRPRRCPRWSSCRSGSSCCSGTRRR